MDVELQLELAQSNYMHGYAVDCADAKPVKVFWNFTTHDMNGRPATLSFDIVEGRSPIIIGLDLKRYSDTRNMPKESNLTFQRPSEKWA